MNRVALLRRKAAFCLRLSQFCTDQPVSRHLSFLAARYHERLRAELGVPADDEQSEAETGSPWSQVARH
jgi:hypothetical protein